MPTYLLLCLVVFFAGFIHGLSGFGSILLSLPLLAVFLDIKAVIPLVALYGLAITILLLLQLWRHLEFKKLYQLLAGALPGVPVGVFFLKALDRAAILWILGITLILYSLYAFFYRSTRQSIKERWGYLFGFFAGCLGGALGATGPAVIVYTSLQAWDKDRIKVTLQGFFLISGITVVFLHAVNGLTTLPILKLFLVSVPAMILGTYAGSFVYGKVGEKDYRRIILLIIALLGVFQIYRAL
jgi:uncharacterized membrane protein YfcA